MATAARVTPPATEPITAEQFYALVGDGKADLVDGVIVYDVTDSVTPAAWRHGSVSMRLAAALGAHVYPRAAGELFDGATGFLLRREPPLVRSPDMAFVAARRLPPDGVADPVVLSPDLAVEVLSPSDTAAEMNRRLVDYFTFGTHVVWIVDPDARTVTVHAASAIPRLLRDTDLLDGGDVLPGFSTPVAALFAGLAPRA